MVLPIPSGLDPSIKGAKGRRVGAEDYKASYATTQSFLENLTGYSPGFTGGEFSTPNDIYNPDNTSHIEAYANRHQQALSTAIAYGMHLIVDPTSTANNLILTTEKVDAETKDNSTTPLNYAENLQLPFAFRSNLKFTFTATANNTGSVSITISNFTDFGSTPIVLKKQNGTNLIANDIKAEYTYTIITKRVYDVTTQAYINSLTLITADNQASTEVVNNLTSTSQTAALSANMGRELNNAITAKQNIIFIEVDVVETGNITLSGVQTIDGIAGTAGITKVLLTGQTNKTQNGVWTMQSGAWTRLGDFVTAYSALRSRVWVKQGTNYSKTIWNNTNTSAITITTAITYEQNPNNTQTQLNNKSDTNHTHSNATTTTAGFMSSTDKQKLDAYSPGYKNAIINGDFRIWQDGTSFTNPISGTYLADEWSLSYDNSGLIGTFSQQTFTPGELEGIGLYSPFYARCNISSFGSSTYGFNFMQKIENVRTFAGQVVTVTFYFRSSVANKTVLVGLDQYFGVAGSSMAFGTKQAITPINTNWNKYTLTFSIPSISGKAIGSNNQLQFVLQIPTTGGVGIFDLAYVQAEAGSFETPFEYRPEALELMLCQRYYEKSKERHSINGTNYAIPRYAYKATKRVIPAITLTWANGASANLGVGLNDVDGFTATTSSAGQTDFTWVANARQ